MRRGFKAEAERRAEAARAEMGLDRLAKLDPRAYADRLGVLVFDVNDLELDPDHAQQLLVRDPDSWSGMTLDEDGVRLIVLNNAHSRRRQCSTLMHELSHLVLDHVPASVNVSPSGLTLLSDYSDEQEEEADWLGGALLLPQTALIHYRGMGWSIQALADHFGVSVDLCNWRCRMTGVEKRLAFRARA